MDAVQRAVTNYYSINDQSPDTFMYTYVEDEEGEPVPAPLTLTVTQYTDIPAALNPSKRFSGQTVTTTYTLNETFYGPLDYSEGYDTLRLFFNSLVSMELTIPPLDNFAFGSLYRNCLRWSNVVYYNFENRGQVQYVLRPAASICCARRLAADTFMA